MAASFRRAPVYEEDRCGVTIAVAVLLRIEGPRPGPIDIGRWVHEIDATLLPLLGAKAETCVGITIRASERSGARVAEDLILNAAVACPTYFKRAQDETPTRTVAHFARPQGGVTN
jgi:hypothetical protein